MKFLKTLFGAKDKEPKLKTEFADQVEKAIRLVAQSELGMENEQFMDLLLRNGIPREEATDIFLFLPVAFTKHWLPDVKWLDSYIEYFSEEKQIERKFSETPSYQVIDKVTRRYFENAPNPDTVLKIGGRSAEFNAINQALNNNPTLRLEEIVLSPTVVMR